MLETMRIAYKDLLELIRGPRGIVLALLPPLILVWVGNLRIESPGGRVLVAGIEPCESTGDLDPEQCLFEFLLNEFVNVDNLVVETEPEADPLARIEGEGFDIILNVEELGGTRLGIFYIAETDPVRLPRLLMLAENLQTTLFFSYADADLSENLVLLGGILGQAAFLYYPAAGDPSLRSCLKPSVLFSAYYLSCSPLPP